MMQGAVRAARFGEPPPADLRLAFMCGPHHLPDAGGIYEQDYETFNRMRVLDNIYSVAQKVVNLKGHEIHKLSVGERRTLSALREQGVWDG